MENYRIYAYEDENFIKGIGKKHTESDIAIYGRKDDHGNSTIFVPSRYPDKISSLTDSMTLAQIVVINGKNMNAYLGENILCADVMTKSLGFITVDDTTDTDRLKTILKNSALKNYNFFNGTSMELLDQIYGMKIEQNKQPETKVIIDHFFKVKSVGTVILGFVLSGTLKKHQELFLNPSGKKIQVKSIQMNDIDFEEAETGSRVGIALKNADIETIDRGSILSEKSIPMVNELKGKIEYHPSVPQNNRNDGEVFLAGNFHYSRGILTDGLIKLDKPILPETEYVVVRPNAKPRIVGRFVSEEYKP